MESDPAMTYTYTQSQPFQKSLWSALFLLQYQPPCSAIPQTVIDINPNSKTIESVFPLPNFVVLISSTSSQYPRIPRRLFGFDERGPLRHCSRSTCITVALH